MANNMFRKRAGTTDKGKYYEDLNVANLILKLVTDADIKNFKLSSNDENFGAFDDIVLEVEGNSVKEEKYALQLKHGRKGRTLTKKSLMEETGNFSIKKYFQTFEKVNTSKTCNLILFTNLTFCISDDEQIRLTGEDFDVKIMESQPELLLNTSGRGRSYQFQVIENDANNLSSNKIEEYKTFFKNFFLYTDQANVEEMKNDTMKKFQEMFRCDVTPAEKYLQFVSEWSIREGTKEKLNKILMKRVIALRLLSSFIRPFEFGPTNENAKLLREAIFAFNITFFEENMYQKVRKIWKDIDIDDLQDFKEINKIRTYYQLPANHIKDLEDLNDVEKTVLFWLFNKSPLMVIESETTYEALRLCPEEKFILLRNGSCEIKLENQSIFRNLSDLDPDSETYKNIIKTFKCSLQGKSELTLQFVINYDEEIRKMVTTNELIQMLDGALLIGEERETLPVPYIDRSLSRTTIDDKYLKKIDKNTLIVISCMKKFDLVKEKLLNFNLIKISEEAKKNNSEKIIKQEVNKTNESRPDIYISENICTQKEFREICNRNTNNIRCHHLKVIDNGKFEWVQSQGEIKDLEDYRREDQLIEELELIEAKSDNNINIICADPGTGKSILMKNLKNNLSPEFWTVIIRPKDVFLLCVNHRGDFMKYILDHVCKSYTHFDLALLKIWMEKGHVVYIWDAIDKIFDQHLEIVFGVINNLSRTNSVQWITSRCYLKAILEKKFNVFSRKLNPIDDEQQDVYIKKRLKYHWVCEDLEQITSKLKNNIKMVGHDILGIPLQIFMLTELFRRNPEKYLTLLYDVFSITDLYRHFMDEKFNFFFEDKGGIGKENEFLQRMLVQHKNYVFEDYERAAIKTLFRKNPMEQLNVNCERFLEEIRCSGDRFGLITEIDDDKFPTFVHNSYAEYFAATFLVKNFRNIPNFLDVLFEEKYTNIRLFFDLILAEGLPAHTAVLYKNLEALKTYENQLNHKDLAGRSPLNLACLWGERYPLLRVEKSGSELILDDKIEDLVKEDSFEYKVMLDFLFERRTVEEIDESSLYKKKSICLLPLVKMLNHEILLRHIQTYGLDYIFSVLCYSVKLGYDSIIDLYGEIPFARTKEKRRSLLHLSAEYNQEKCLRKLLSISRYKKAVNDGDLFGIRPLHIACEMGNDDIVQVLITSGANIDVCMENNTAPIYIACQYGHRHVVQLLVEAGANIDVTNGIGATPTYIACQNGHQQVTELLINAGANINIADKESVTPVYLACQNGHEKIVELLIAAGANVNIALRASITPVYVASQNGHEKVLQLLIAAGADVNAANDQGATPTYIASQDGHHSIVRMLIGAGAKIDIADQDGATPLYLACQNGHEEVVELLIDAGADINIARNDGWRPIHSTCNEGHGKILQLLVEAGADIHGCDSEGWQPLHLACQNGHEETVRLLITFGANINVVTCLLETPVYIAYKNGYNRVAELLISAGAEVNITNLCGYSPIHLACHSGQEEVVRRLIEAGAEINIVAEDGVTPVYLACRNGYDKVLQLLISAGANVDAVDQFGETPIFVACQNGHDAIVKLLIAAGASFNVSKRGNLAPLHLACYGGHDKIVQTLISAGANIHVVTPDFATPLHLACKNGYARVAQLLIEGGADCNVSCLDGFTPTYMACENGHDKVAQLLIAHGADINKGECKPIHVACQNGHEKIAQLLIAAGANINTTSTNGTTPLHMACRSGHDNVANLLMAAGANCNKVKSSGWKPVHVACFQGHGKIVRSLIAHGVDGR